MGYAFTTNEPVWVPAASGSSPAALLSAIDTAGLEAGWTHRTDLGNGWVYELASPQLLACTLKVWDEGDSYLRLQFASFDALREGAIHRLYCEPGRVYQAIVQQCQLWISLPGVSQGSNNCVAGGILFVPDAGNSCGAETPVECWWSMASPDSEPLFPQYFLWWRNSYQSRNGVPYLASDVSWSACYDGVLTLSTEVGAGSQLRIFPVTPGHGNVTSRDTPATRWWSGRPVYHEPLVGWGTADDNGILHVRGQLFDAYCASESRTIDHVDVETFEGRTLYWMNFLGNPDDAEDPERSRFMALYLLRGRSAIGARVYAY